MRHETPAAPYSICGVSWELKYLASLEFGFRIQVAVVQRGEELALGFFDDLLERVTSRSLGARECGCSKTNPSEAIRSKEAAA